MQNSERKPEVLAPAGNYESLEAAINNGADAVYLGLKEYGARAKAENFDLVLLKKAIKKAHFFGVKVYLTVNTLPIDNEKSGMLDAIKAAYKIGIDAIILQDFTLLREIKCTMPDIIIHLSTQSGVHNVYGATVARKLGADRVILSREATIDDIKDIKQNCDIEVEAFVQGALCVSFSGNCYFSSLISGYSGNRGKCLQLCRKKYTLDGKVGYWLSPKDMSLVTSLKALIEAGVDSLKIEGRMRRPEYVAVATKVYRNAVDGENYDFEALKRMYNRGNYTRAHLFEPTENVIYPFTQSHIGSKVGIIRRVDGKKAVLSCSLRKGDAVKFLREGVETGTAQIFADGGVTTYVGDVKRGDDVNITTDHNLIKAVKEVASKTVGVRVEVSAAVDSPLFVKISTDRVSKTYYSDFSLSPAYSAPMSENDFKDVFAKCKDYGFNLADFSIDLSGKVFCVKSVLNDFRRKCFEDYGAVFENSYVRAAAKNKVCDDSVFDCARNGIKNRCVCVKTDDYSFALELLNSVDYVIYSPVDFKDVENIVFDDRIYLDTPQIARSADLGILKRIASRKDIKKVVVNNLYGLELFKNKQVLLGEFLNIVCDDFDADKVLSVEAGVGEKSFSYCYGFFPFMTFCHCPRKNLMGSCNGCEKRYDLTLSDENGNKFTFRRFSVAYCYSHLLNSKPIDISYQLSKNDVALKKFLDFRGVSKSKACVILKKFMNGEPTGEEGIKGYFDKKPE